MQSVSIRQVITLTRLSAQIILENGGETYRAEDTVIFIGRSLGYDTEVLSFPTGIIITLADEENDMNTVVKRIKKRSVNLTAIHLVNDLSRKIVDGSIDVNEAIGKLRSLKNGSEPSAPLMYTAASLSPAAFTLLYGGSLFDCFISAICGFLIQWVYNHINIDDNRSFAMSLISGAIIAAIACFSVDMCNTGNINAIITGGITPLLPGLTMITAIRDAMRGDLLSGVARIAEGALVAIALAFGVGAVLSVHHMI